MNNILSEAGSVTGIGLVIVFLGLIILIACIYLMAALFRDHGADKPAPAPAPAKPAPAPQAAPAAPATPAAAQVDAQLLAVIAAAIAAMDGANKPLVIRSVRRVPGWNRAARAEQVYRF